MGNENYSPKENKHQKSENKKLLENISIIDSEKNIIKKNNLLINNKIEKTKINNDEDDFQSIIIKEIQDINSALRSLKEKNNKKKRNINEYYEKIILLNRLWMNLSRKIRKFLK